eukprot:1537007-Karenia_brevis.AAC.1
MARGVAPTASSTWADMPTAKTMSARQSLQTCMSLVVFLPCWFWKHATESVLPMPRVAVELVEWCYD